MGPKQCFVILSVIGVPFLLLFYYINLPSSPTLKAVIFKTVSQAGAYLVNTPTCKIPDLNPLDESIRPYIKRVADAKCSDPDPSVTTQDGLLLYINKSLFEENFGEFAICTMREVHRKDDTDNEVVMSKVLEIDPNVSYIEVSDDILCVECFNKKAEKKYQNCHTFVHPTPNIGTNFTRDNSQITQRRLNVIFLGLDSVSRLNMLRQLTRTRLVLENQLEGMDFQGYNKVADNTFINIVPLLANKFIAEVPFSEKNDRKKFLDDFGFIWNEFAEKGYRTLLAEDYPAISTFNYLKAGFRKPPTHYYLRPFTLAMRSYKSLWYDNSRCFVDRLETQIVLDYLMDFLDMHKNNSYFAYTFLTRHTHDSHNEAGVLDHILADYLLNLKRNGHLDNTVLFFFSDHGMRFGELRTTYIGKMEERLPMMFIYLPKWFREAFPRAANNILLNRNRLTTPFDIYSTLKDILYLNFNNVVPVNGSDRGISLFSEMPLNRSCEQAAIEPHWCTCHSQTEVSTNDTYVLQAANEAVHYINNITNITECARLELKTVNRAWTVVSNTTSLQDRRNVITDYQLMFTTTPGDGQFESTVRHFVSKKYFLPKGEISRINLYGSQSHCISNTRLKKYCYCI